MGGYPAEEGMEPELIADRPAPVARDAEWDAIIKKLEGDLVKAGRRPGGSPGGAPPGMQEEFTEQVTTPPAPPPPDPLGISNIDQEKSLAGMPPERQALGRTVFGMARKGSAAIGEATQGAIDTYQDFPKTFPEFMERLGRPANMRGVLRGVGGAAGGMLGFAYGGPPGVMWGTGGGSAAGGYLANAYEDIRNWAQETGEKPETVERLMRPLVDAAWDADFSGGIVAAPVLGREARNVLGRMLRVPPNSRQLMEEAATVGVDIGVANVASGGIGKGAVNVFGRMPIIGGSAQNAAKGQAKSIAAAYEDMFGPLSNATASTEISQAALIEARKRYQEWAVPAIQRYEHALRVGGEQGAVLPTERVLKATGEVLAAVTSKSGKLQGALPADMKSYLNGIVKNLEGDKMSVVDANNLLIGVENLARKAMGQQGIHYSKLDRISEAIEMTLRSSDAAGAKLLVGARQNFKEGLDTFQTEIYKKMVGTVDRNIFALGKMKDSTMTADEFINMVDKVKSPAQVKQLRDAAGDPIVRNAAATRIDDAWIKATGTEPGTFGTHTKFTFDAGRFTKALGLDKPDGQQFATMKELLRGTGVEIDDVIKLSRVAELVGRAPISDASTFMARAAVLRGAGGIAGAVKSAMTFGGGAAIAAGSGYPSAIAAALMMRWGVGQFMKPGLLKLATTAMDPTLDTAVQAAAVAQMATNWPNLFNE